MKKILMLCSMFVLLFALSVSTFAANSSYSYGGHILPYITLPSDLPYHVLLLDEDGVYYFYFLEDYLYKSGTNLITSTNVDYSSYKLNDDGTYSLYLNSWGKPSIPSSQVVWSSHDISGVIQGSEPFEVNYCDGSTCPATDTNGDRICDDCGLPFADGFTPETPTPEPDTGTTPDSGTTEIIFNKYNYCKLPDINTVWPDKETLKAAAIIHIKESNSYRLILGTDWIYNYIHTEQYDGNDVETYFRMGDIFMIYDLVGDTWTYTTSGTSSTYVRTATSDLVWANTLIYDDQSKEYAYTHFFSHPRLTTVMTQRGLSGAMTEILKLIPMTMACLVSYVALRKSLTFLLNLFQSA